MSNHYIDKEYDKNTLINIREGLFVRLNVVGDLYDNKEVDEDTLNLFEKDYRQKSMDWNYEGFNYGDQIYKLYAEIGAINEAMEKLDGS